MHGATAAERTNINNNEIEAFCLHHNTQHEKSFYTLAAPSVLPSTEPPNTKLLRQKKPQDISCPDTWHYHLLWQVSVRVPKICVRRRPVRQFDRCTQTGEKLRESYGLITMAKTKLINATSSC